MSEIIEELSSKSDREDVKPKIESDSTTNRRSSRVEAKKVISLFSPTDRKLIGLIKNSRKIRLNGNLEKVRCKWLPYVVLTRLTPDKIFRLADGWSFLKTLNIINSITFIPKIQADRFVRTKFGYERQCFVTWSFKSYNRQIGTSLKYPVVVVEPTILSACLDCMKSSLTNEAQGSWIESGKVPAHVIVDIQNLPWELKLFIESNS